MGSTCNGITAFTVVTFCLNLQENEKIPQNIRTSLVGVPGRDCCFRKKSPHTSCSVAERPRSMFPQEFCAAHLIFLQRFPRTWLLNQCFFFTRMKTFVSLSVNACAKLFYWRFLCFQRHAIQKVTSDLCTSQHGLMSHPVSKCRRLVLCPNLTKSAIVPI